MKIAIINGPNLNLVGTREPDIYGSDSIDDYIQWLRKKYVALDITYFQSNVEGEIINEIHLQSETTNAIIINAGAYTHTSIAIADALKAVKTKMIIEVHLSNVYAREDYRKISFIAPASVGSICGFGLKSYELAIQSLLS
jgi:3-dehydroquinate dehydratase-2